MEPFSRCFYRHSAGVTWFQDQIRKQVIIHPLAEGTGSEVGSTPGVDVTVEVKKMVIPDSTDTSSETDEVPPTAYTTDNLNLGVSGLLVSYVLQTTESFF